MSHLSEGQRYTIAAMKSSGYSQKAIAAAIGRDKSVVSREINRNSDGRSGEYKSELAQRKYESRQKGKKKAIHFTEAIEELVVKELRDKLSPEQIAGKAKREGKACVSHERIYQFVWKDKKKGGDLYTELRTTGKRYRHRGASKDKRGQIQGRVDIAERPEIVEKRERFGDLEIDTIIGKDHKGAILTINDRATGMVRIKKLNGKNAEELAEKTIEVLEVWREWIHTITSDNGKEFACHEQISQALGIDFYFAKPYHSWERGSNENLNGLIRQYIPKRTDFSLVSEEYIEWVEHELNNRPRKRFDYDSPFDIFISKVAFMG